MIEAGTLLIDKNAPRPECFHLETNPDPGAWTTVAHGMSARELEAALAANGWTLSYVAGAIHATGVGFNPANRMSAAVKRLTAIAAGQECNCLEIDEVSAHSFLGVPYVNISAHSRQVERAVVFSGQ